MDSGVWNVNTITWMMEAVLAFAFVIVGTMKLVRPHEKIRDSGGQFTKWVEDFSAGNVKIIGVVELLAGIGIIVPRLLHHGHYSTSIAASVIVIIMIGATYTHIRRGEYHLTAATIVLMAFALFVGYHTCPGMAH